MSLGKYCGTACFLFTLILSGCASPPESSPATAQQSQTSSERPSDAEALSQGQTVQVETSQGTISVEPTVVGITDEAATPSSTPGDTSYYDPLEGFNRAMFGFNHYFYTYFFIPVTDGYRVVVPDVARDKIGNAFDNLREPLNLLSHTFSGDLDKAGINLGRFVINSTIGLLGLFDPATHWFSLAQSEKTIAQTLRDYDVGSGAYIVLPVLGPSDVRGTFSTVTEGFLHPTQFIMDAPDRYYLRMFEGVDDFESQSQRYEKLYEEASDPYLYFRNQHIQGQLRDAMFDTNKASGNNLNE
ncbi:MlaA family lipoprotein [Alteromonas halophila]|uniref:VacJ family lipoprotein n=1 Tax=Alteromonas halophila TaxID=516698 RepID=A0A918N0I7_9ALTE|nr:VacJ family lipoprotein [Alteromonas halophila]GGW89983.1 hypothetical protein GCM10007391_25410 [Alteromonas halophila]